MRDALLTLLRAVRTLGSGIAAILAALFGRWHWEAPAWLTRAGALGARIWRSLVSHPARAALLVFVLAATAGGYLWWASRPKPHYVTFSVSAPGLTTYNDNGIASIKPMKVVFSESAAPLRQVKTVLTAGIALSPAIAGTWFWTSDRELQFTPKGDWPVDGAFTVKLSTKDLLARQVQLDHYSFTFRSQPFSARISESQFYQDPRDPNLKKIVATVEFSHPVDAERFESHVSLAVAKDAEYLGLTPDSRHFTVAYDKFHLAAYIHSAALAMPRDDTPMTLRIDQGVRAARGGNDTTVRLEAVVTIPGRNSLAFSNAQIAVVDNARYEPEQILLLTSSSPVLERAFDGKVSVRLLPVRHPRQPKENRRPYDWLDPGEIGGDILAGAEPVSVSYVPSDEGGDTSHGFKFNAPVDRYLHVMVKADVQGTGGYISAKMFVATVRVGPYPRALTFLGQGALLPLSGDRRVGFIARDVGRVQVEIGRVLPNQLQHLAPQMWDFSHPGLYGGMEDKLVERFATTRDYSATPPGKPVYDSIDVGQYLRDQTQSRRGLFLLRVRQVARRPAGVEEGEDPEGDVGGGYGGIEDKRLILVTDLGFVVKQSKDGSRDVFVQSIGTGLPVEGARVELVGSNGLPVLATTTDAGGRAQLPKPPPQLRRERTPQMIVVQRDADFSFMPFNTGNRELDLSRFDTGGVVNAKSAQQLSTYLFSDRGIYRPGETAHLGAITRTADWKASLGGLPLDFEITDPRGLVVSRTQLAVSASSFDEISYTSPPAAPTGTYEAVAYLAKDAKHREMLGSTSFKVQEFEPDRTKVQLDLAVTPIEGWLKPDDVKARITVAHLFGEPAGKRRVEGELSLTPALPRFSRHPDYRFSIGEVLEEPYHERLAAAVTDDKGMAEFILDLKRFVGRAYRLNVLGRAYEAEGGRNVAAQNSAIVSEAPSLVGVKPDGDLTFVRRTSARAAHWLAVDQRLAPVAAEGLTLEWVQRKFVSVLTRQGNGTLQYVSRQKEVVRNTRSVRIASGGSSFPLPTDEPGDFVLVLRNASGAALNSLSYTVAGQANLSRSLERDAELQVQLDKPAYAAGDTIQVSIRAPYVGAGLITIERDRVYRHQWFKTTTTSSVQQITLPPDFEGNGYVNVQFLRDPSSDELFMSPLSHGVAAFAPDLAARTQPITLVAPRQVKPGATLTMTLTPGEASRVAVLAVDEGILQVARYKNPDPLGYFFQKRMLEVDTKQILDLILPDLKRFIALAAPGGDADGGFARHLNPFNKKRKPAVAYWSGVVDVGRGGRELKYTVPDYFNGRLRIVAIGASGRRMGVTEVTTTVRGDFILTPNVPATVAPGDEFSVSVGVFNNSGGSGPIRLDAKLGPGLSAVGAASVELQIPEKKEGVAEFRVKANAVLGAAALAFTARRGAASARVEESVGVRPAAPFRTHLTLGRVDGASATSPLAREMYSEHRKVDAAVSTLPLVWGQGLTAYLGEYEYTCTEQLVSKGVSALMLMSRPEFGSISKPDARPLDATFSTLRGRANDQGGLGLWASTPQTAEFPTVYAAHFLVEAQERGQKIPQDILANLDGWLTRFALTPASSLGDARLRAYAVYLLARQGIKPAAALSNVEQELTKRYTKTWPTDLAAAYLASTYRVMQRNDDADRIVKAVPWSTQKKDFGDEVYYDTVVHDAQLLYLLAKHFPARLGATPPAALETISKAVSGNQASSLSAACTLLALDAVAKAAAGTSTLGISEIGKDGRERALPLPSGAMPKVSVAETTAQVKFSQRGAALAYYAINESGFDKRPLAAEVSQGVEIIREFVDAKGSPLSRVVVGDEFFVRLRVRATSRDRQPQIAIVDLLPGGVEPVLELQAPADSSTPEDDPAMQRQRGMSRALPVGLSDKSDWTPDHVDVREDRLILYGDAGRNVGTFVYRVRANNPGVFQAPPAFAEGLYNRTVVGSSRAAALEVVKK
jgi:hypothetical protein